MSARETTTEEAERAYREAFDESPPRYAYPDNREYRRMMRLALERGEPITLEEAYGEELAARIRRGEVVL
ncbi:MAG TPA: hypothetical protein VKA44_09175, partial [Gemmatimonadota bacterium]|nr:hypothetical protein [Gemmatimonadota bacterium]